MKKIVFLFLLALLMTTAVEAYDPDDPVIVKSYDFEIDGIYYKIYPGEGVHVTLNNGSNSYSGDVNIPTNVEYQNEVYVVTGIDHDAFRFCPGLNSVSIPNSVTTIGYKAFLGCSNLSSIKIPLGVKYVGSQAFNKCENLIKAEFTSIVNLCNIEFTDAASNPLYYGKHLYINDEEITDLIIPDNITKIGNSAFCGSAIKSVTIHNDVAEIGAYAFKGCSELTSVNIPNSVTSIERSTFEECTGLTYVTLPKNISSIAQYAFRDCPILNEVYCYAKDVPDFHPLAFKVDDSYFTDEKYHGLTLYVPADVIDDYKAANESMMFNNILPIPIVGDANKNGEVEIGDITSVLTLMANPKAEGYSKKAADANGSGEIEIGDVTAILTIMAGGTE